MTTTDPIRSEALARLAEEFGLGARVPVPDDAGAMDLLRAGLIARIVGFLENDLDGFMNACYRLDIDERRLRDAMMLDTPSDIPARLADLIIARELERAETRARWRSGGDAQE